ncbi:polysaccharide pyruvyl transferase family protein [Aureimonas sp. Leaf324]|uniref:polysaccharide pyruvyl transferase family protein n=1 Tax=Aureimonas sp. Leaf324 TaxID=1736336 RepID=UPI00070216B6|nr:polysaccharide pyruvyl transferase family protein [Aureimonas sp. Leaf324]KQQ81285.1 hypothetical protein ASF65_09810 [Aureimonas sp. Leaf324]
MADGNKKALRELAREVIVAPRMFREWRKLTKAPVRKVAPGAATRVAIVPCVPRNPFGSRGDEAMIQAVIDALRQNGIAGSIGIVTETDALPPHMASQGLVAEPCWGAPWRLAKVFDRIRDYDAVVVIGADLMDGYYSSISSLRLWMVADLFSRVRTAGIITGFSFNAAPRWPVRAFLKLRGRSPLVVNLRDPVSLKRFEEAAPGVGRLVADCAFLLKPEAGADTASTMEWIAAQRASTNVVGLNVHPMLSPDRDPAAIERIVQATAEATRTLIDRRGVSVLLLPHDFRPGNNGDVAMLERVAAAVDRPDRVRLQAGEISAAEIKGLAAETELVISARMHLAIAALGAGVPVVGITYQDKFEGLFEHFSLPKSYLIDRTKAGDAALMTRVFDDAFMARGDLRASVEAHVGDVKAKSRSTFDALGSAIAG